MVSVKSLVSAGLMTTSILASSPHDKKYSRCGEISIIYTGLPAHHYYAAAQGWDVESLDRDLRASHETMIKAGYNSRVVLAGPEQSLDVLASHIDGMEWNVTGMGFGMRGAQLKPVVHRFEENIQLFREKVPGAPTVFNSGPSSFLWSLEEWFPLAEDCTGKPGKDLGYYEFCGEGWCLDATTAAKLQKDEL